MVSKENSLRLKQIFVRHHVSHEIRWVRLPYEYCLYYHHHNLSVLFICRSPLNVVHGGLDLLMSEIRVSDPNAEFVPISRSTVELIQHIFSSSESAIDLLNDLLHYEQIDAGNSSLSGCRTLSSIGECKIPILTHTGIFKLELSWRGLGGSFHNKLAWAQILAEGNRVTLSIEDSTLATSCASSMELDIEQSGRWWWWWS